VLEREVRARRPASSGTVKGFVGVGEIVRSGNVDLASWNVSHSAPY
jgi:hypothetical protein